MTKLDYPATSRNREAILEVLQNHLPASGLVLEVASGSGQHCAFFAPKFPNLGWQPSDYHSEALASIDAWAKGIDNIKPAINIDVASHEWPQASYEVIFNANMIHISPWTAAEALFKGAEQSLKPGGLLFLYGPYIFNDRETAPSNLDFDRSLRQRNSEWGVRNFDDIMKLATNHHLTLQEVVTMPANNFCILYQRSLV